MAVLNTISPVSPAPGAGEIGAPTLVAVKGKRGMSTPLLFPGLALTSNNAEELGAFPVVLIPTFWAKEASPPAPLQKRGKKKKIATVIKIILILIF